MLFCVVPKKEEEGEEEEEEGWWRRRRWWRRRPSSVDTVTVTLCVVLTNIIGTMIRRGEQHQCYPRHEHTIEQHNTQAIQKYPSLLFKSALTVH
jgi:hypothetical protein